MTYLIDGYNLMYAAGIAARAMPAAQFDRARARFLDWLADGTTGRPVAVRVVFDAQQAPTPSLESLHRGVRVRFAYRRTADDLIEELVATEPRPKLLTVVSNDARVREAGRRAECPLATCEEFMDWLLNGDKPQGSGAPDGEEKPEPKPDDVDELLNVFTKPKR
jgi:hypothetical protein